MKYQPLIESRAFLGTIIFLNSAFGILKVSVMPSTVVSNYVYIPESRTLRVTFVSGAVYDYKKVPEVIYLEMEAAFSKGTFLNENIKDNFEFERIE